MQSVVRGRWSERCWSDTPPPSSLLSVHRPSRPPGQLRTQIHSSASSSCCRTQLASSLMPCLTWQGFGAWFGGQTPSLNHFHLQLAAPIHDGNVHISCNKEEGMWGLTRPRSGLAAEQSPLAKDGEVDIGYKAVTPAYIPLHLPQFSRKLV